jgi:hypothetical protein
MKWLTAYSIVTIAQLNGYTDCSPTVRLSMDNRQRIASWGVRGFDVSVSGPCNCVSECAVMSFQFSPNQN